METVIASVISALAAVIVCVINNSTQHKKTVAKVEEMNNLNQFRIGQLEKKMDKHNNLIERTYKLEQQEAILEEKMRVANHRIDDLEHETA